MVYLFLAVIGAYCEFDAVYQLKNIGIVLLLFTSLAVLFHGLVIILFGRTSLGLKVKATMQNRDMATALGVNTRAVDRFTFAFGSGLAGIAGCCLTLIGGVTLDMGQNYMVESFLVVVTGGVGELLGVIFSGFGIGILTKILEPMNIAGFDIGAIWSKVLVLIFVVIFIQFKPSGLFPPKGRLADD